MGMDASICSIDCERDNHEHKAQTKDEPLTYSALYYHIPLLCVTINHRGQGHKLDTQKSTRNPKAIDSCAMDESNEMDLALNGDFDSELFDCWDSTVEPEQEAVGNTHHRRAASGNVSQTDGGARNDQASISFHGVVQHSKQAAGTVSWTASASSSIQQNPPTAAEQGLFHPPMSDANSTTSQAATVSVSDAASSASSFHQLLSTFASLPAAQQRSLDPRAILSSANCPPHGGARGVAGADKASLSVAGFSTTNMDSNMPQQPQGEQHHDPVLSQQQQQHFDLTSAALLPLAMNALAAGVTLPLPLMLQAAQQAQKAMNHTGVQPPQEAGSGQHVAFVGQCLEQQTPNAVMPQPPFPQSSQDTGSNNTQHAVPPFNLFDAPAELRANFLSSQRTAGIVPLLNDPNQFHFGIAVNGFHPQNNMTVGQPPLVDARQTQRNNMKNAKEQRRAQKITDLIENLRVKMEEDNWQVGLSKSKFNTLSCCADYIRNLVKITNDKEAAIKKKQCDLEAARKKLDDDKIQSDRSDPESTTSSLTVSSGSAAKDGDKNSASIVGNVSDKKRSASFEILESNCVKENRSVKRVRCQELTGTSSNESDPGSSIKVSAESVSDVTGSNSNSGSGSDEACPGSVQEHMQSEGFSEDDISSDAAVKLKVDEQSNPSSAHCKKRKHFSLADTPLTQNGFDLDYQEVFLNSNIPQLLATTDGRILAWNTFFLRATGFNEETIKKATIFGLVKCSKLANLFEIVAKALRNKSQSSGDYLATTLPCVKFHACERKQLFITVTFMADVDPRKRCFHCVLTDSPPTMESPGPVTEKLLLMLLSDCQDEKKLASRNEKIASNDSGTDSGNGCTSDNEEGTAEEESGSVDCYGDTVDENEIKSS